MINEKDKKILEDDIHTVLENVACSGRDADGDYISKMTEYIMAKIHLADLKSDLNAVRGIFRIAGKED